MKKIALSLLILLVLFGITSRAQVSTSTGDIVSKENVTIEMIKSIFQNSYYEITETAATYIKIKDTYSIYIDLDDDKRYLTFSVNWPINESFSMQQKFDLLNKISKEVLLVTPYYSTSNSTLVVKATVWIEGGNTAKNIVLNEKIFVKALNLILDKDTLQIIK
jgi:hypothetical protein